MITYHIIENLDDSYGGPAKSVPNLAYALKNICVEGELLSLLFCDDECNEVIKDKSLVWHKFRINGPTKFRFSIKLSIYLMKKINKRRDIIIHSHNIWNYISLIPLILRLKYKIDYVVSVRGSLYPWSLRQNYLVKKVAWILYQKKSLNSASFVHVTDKSELDAVRDLGITAPIAIVPNGIDIKSLNTLGSSFDARKNLGLNQSKKYILFMSRIHPKKGLEYIVGSWIKYANQYPEWDMIIAGPIYDDKYYENILNEVSISGLNERFHFFGMAKGRVRLDCFAASNLFVLPSHTENFGMSIVEAMASKIPVITTTGTPWSEIKEMGAGWWVELNQSNIDSALVSALECDQSRMTAMGEIGLKIAKNYTWEMQAEKMKVLYEWVKYKSNKPDYLHIN